MAVMMKCGHVAVGILRRTGLPVCSTCFGLTPDAEVAVEAPDLEGRRARCAYYGSVAPPYRCESNYGTKGGEVCRAEEDSDIQLPFFALKEGDFDEFYCGCHSWD